jgi:hypothetical protein
MVRGYFEAEDVNVRKVRLCVNALKMSSRERNKIAKRRSDISGVL